MSRFVFPEWTQRFRKLAAVLAAGGVIYIGVLIAYGVSPEAIRIGYQPEQPVPYSHALHVGELGLDCTYCHTAVTESAHAAIPPVATCMNCHAGIRAESDKLLPVREAFASGAPLAWVKVHDLPDYESCHGRIDRMEVVYQAEALTMEWCLECHRAPERHLRPPEMVTVMGYEPPGDPIATGRKLRELNGINPRTDCSTCHR